MKRNSEKSDSSRFDIGKRSGVVGIVCNLALSIGKLIFGGMSGSTSIVADGLNNLSDAASSVITLLGFALAERPADKKHPYGHARFEYLASLTVSVLMLVIGFELIKASFDKILHPTQLVFSLGVIAVLIFSVLLKLFLMFYQLHEGKRIKSVALLAVAADSRNDAIATGAIIVSTVIEYLTDWKIDGFMGLFVSLFILYNGVSLAKKTVSPLLGESASPELQKEIVSRIKSHPAVIDCHDLMVHDYGPGRTYASIHVEMDGEMNSIVSHEWIDEMERDCQERFGVHLTVHYDPVLVNDPQSERLRRLVIAVLKAKDERLEIHDFRVLTKEEGCELAFDILLPEDLVGQKAELEEELGEKLRVFETNQYVFRINFDV